MSELALNPFKKCPWDNDSEIGYLIPRASNSVDASRICFRTFMQREESSQFWNVCPMKLSNQDETPDISHLKCSSIRCKCAIPECNAKALGCSDGNLGDSYLV